MERTSRDCLFCTDPKNKKKLTVNILMKKALYTKYSSSQNYYYTKDINDIMADARTPAVIKYKDFTTLDEEDEFLKLALVGLISLLTIQTFIHLGVNTRLLPTTGMTLPFLSYGGSSLIGSSIIAGIILNFTRKDYKRKST